MISDKEIVCPNNLLDVAHTKKGVTAGIVNAGKPLPMLSIQDAVNENLIEPVVLEIKDLINLILLPLEDFLFDLSVNVCFFAITISL